MISYREFEFSFRKKEETVYDKYPVWLAFRFRIGKYYQALKHRQVKRNKKGQSIDQPFRINYDLR